MKRYCATCSRDRDLRAFDLATLEANAACRECARERSIELAREERAVRRAEIVALKHERRSLIAALVRIDARLAELETEPGALIPVASTSESDEAFGFDSEPLVD